MKYLIRLFLIAAVVATVFTFAAARPAAAEGCPILDIAGPASGMVPVVQGHVYHLYHDGILVQVYVAPITGLVPYGFGVPGRWVLVDAEGTCPEYFNPNDGRVDPRPGDRVAAYCGATTLAVWGVTDDSVGHLLFTFNKADLVAAGASGILKAVEPLGSVSAAVNADGIYTVRWYGGPAAATGTKDFAKIFTCPK
jgi:hypothetical protein